VLETGCKVSVLMFIVLFVFLVRFGGKQLETQPKIFIAPIFDLSAFLCLHFIKIIDKLGSKLNIIHTVHFNFIFIHYTVCNESLKMNPN
jgi:hypothetical protein